MAFFLDNVRLIFQLFCGPLHALCAMQLNRAMLSTSATLSIILLKIAISIFVDSYKSDEFKSMFKTSLPYYNFSDAGKFFTRCSRLAIIMLADYYHDHSFIGIESQQSMKHSEKIHTQQ